MFSIAKKLIDLPKCGSVTDLLYCSKSYMTA